jgi:hypothetical protein
VAVRLDNHEHRFALEYERTPKAKRHYRAIRKRIEAETEFRHFLYLTPNHDMLTLLLREFECCHRPVHFGLRNDFLADTISLTVQTNHSPVSTTFRAVLTAGSFRSGKGTAATITAQAPLFT